MLVAPTLTVYAFLPILNVTLPAFLPLIVTLVPFFVTFTMAFSFLLSPVTLSFDDDAVTLIDLPTPTVFGVAASAVIGAEFERFFGNKKTLESL